MDKDCITCGRRVVEIPDDPKNKQSHGSGVWKCDCGTIMRNRIETPDNLRGRAYRNIPRKKPIKVVTDNREISGEVIKEFTIHRRMY